MKESGNAVPFDTGSVALEFAYTGSFAEVIDVIDTPDDLGGWLVARFPAISASASEGELRDAVALRAAIARMATAASHRTAGRDTSPAAEDIDLVNLFAATPDIPPVLAGGSRQAGRSHAHAAQALSALAREAVDVFAAENAERIRPCAAADCERIFFDESRSNNRRWCSMQRCGNRAKARAHRGRASRQ